MKAPEFKTGLFYIKVLKSKTNKLYIRTPKSKTAFLSSGLLPFTFSNLLCLADYSFYYVLTFGHSGLSESKLELGAHNLLIGLPCAYSTTFPVSIGILVRKITI